ncbi:MAG TPA: hypothetical protein VF791_11480 [Pyrinomonadaceae bacterium]
MNKLSGLRFRKPTFVLLALLLLPLTPQLADNSFEARAHALALRDQDSPRVLEMPQGVRRRRRARVDRRRRRGIRSAFKRAGKSAGRGGKRFGQNVARGRVVRGGREFGKGMGGFGKHTGKGVKRTMQRVFKP